MRQCIINGAKAHPGANILEKQGAGYKIALKVVRNRDARMVHARGLEIGDVVHRHVRDGE